MLAVAMGFTACSSDDDFVSNPDQSGRIRAYATTEQESATRTALNGDDTNGYQVFWSADDKITIGGKVFTLDEGVGTSTGGFELKTGEEDPTAGDDVIAYYPSEYNGTNWPTTQTYVANNIPQGVPMKATGISIMYGEGPMVSPISFKNEGGILRLNLKGTAKVASIKISATNLTNPITLNCEITGVELNTTTATPFHIAVPGEDEGTAYSGLKIEITDDAGAVCTKTLKNDKTITVQRSKITDITLTAGSFVTPVQTTGNAEATIGGVKTNVKWVQLWKDGPKFAEYNVNVDMTFTEATKAGAEYVWGANWCTPSKEQMDELLKAATSTGSEKVTCQYCEYTEGDGKWGFKFTGLTDGYTSNSVFFPAQGGDSSGGGADYWSGTADGSGAWNVSLHYYDGDWNSYWESCLEFNYFLVRPVLKETPATTGTAEVNESAGITGNKVNWVQLWKNGPKFAEYNVGATSATEYGGYYTWGGINKNEEGIWLDDHIEGTSNLSWTGDNITDTATKLWGDKWRMPTEEEFDNLLAKCDVEWIDGDTKKYNNTTVTGLLCTGKDAYSSNSVFLPAAGDCVEGNVYDQGVCGIYWSSTPADSDRAYGLYFNSDNRVVFGGPSDYGCSVRAVLAE